MDTQEIKTRVQEHKYIETVHNSLHLLETHYIMSSQHSKARAARAIIDLLYAIKGL